MKSGVVPLAMNTGSIMTMLSFFSIKLFQKLGSQPSQNKSKSIKTLVDEVFMHI